MLRFESLEIWKLSIEYGKKLYKVANAFPKIETFALADQLRRASVSISNNIAEGSGSDTVKDFINFLNFSIKSTLETLNILYFAKEQDYITVAAMKNLYDEAELLVKKIRAFKKSISTQ